VWLEKNYYLFMNSDSHLPRKIDSLNCLCHNDSPSSSLFGEMQCNLLGYGSPVASIGDDKLPPLEHHRTCSLVQLESVEPMGFGTISIGMPQTGEDEMAGVLGVQWSCSIITSVTITSILVPLCLKGGARRERGGARRRLGWTPASSPASYRLRITQGRGRRKMGFC
jgi:hypothetical protein